MSEKPLRPHFTAFRVKSPSGETYIAECERYESGADHIKILNGRNAIYLQNSDRSHIIQLLDASGEFFDSLGPTTKGGEPAGGS